MAVAYRDIGQNSGSGTTITVNKPSGVVDNDFLILAIVSSPSTVAAQTPSGWTLQSIVSDAPRDQRLTVFTKTAASESSTWVVTYDSSVTTFGVIVAYSGADTTTPLNTKASAVGSSSTTQTTPSITPSVDNCKIVAIHGIDINESKYPATPDSSPAATERLEGQDTGSWQHGYVQDYDQGTAAAISLDATFSSTAVIWMNWIGAVAPAVGGGTAPSLRTAQSNLRW
jgi:hypothetical protein